MQKIVVYYDEDTKEINKLLESGWAVVQINQIRTPDNYIMMTVVIERINE